MTNFGSYKVLPLKLASGPFSRFLYVKEHQDKTGVAAKRTLFVSNIPKSASKKFVHDIFSICGSIESISLSRPSSDANTTRFAHVIFISAKSVKEALALDSIDSPQEHSSQSLHGLAGLC
jgi:RNA recognition motif-containing protein